jgi:hypothetical protein
MLLSGVSSIPVALTVHLPACSGGALCTKACSTAASGSRMRVRRELLKVVMSPALSAARLMACLLASSHSAGTVRHL